MKTSKELRQDAAEELRKSCNGGSPAEKADNQKRAAAYQALAANEDWLEGESVAPGEHAPLPNPFDRSDTE
jgi:hypothetical protein